jgi:isocitrate dehydrogenase
MVSAMTAPHRLHHNTAKAAYRTLDEAADLIVSSLEEAIAEKVVTYDFARHLEGATEVRTSEFATAMIERM